jgi:uncharacterized protein (TIGR00297 family)
MNPLQLGLGLVLSTLIGGLAYWRRSLTLSGWAGAILVGTLTFGFGGWAWGCALIAFFISSSLLSRFKEALKNQRAGEKFAKGGQRDFWQAVANGGLGAFVALLYGLGGTTDLLLAFFAGLMGTVTADTWATELGVLSNRPPRLITTGQVVEPGTSGGITSMGTAAAAAGGLFIGLCLFLFGTLEGSLGGSSLAARPWVIAAALVGGLTGALFDSLLGATVQALYAYPDGRETERTMSRDGQPTTFLRGWPWLNNDLVNFLSSVVGGLVAVVVFLLMAS